MAKKATAKDSADINADIKAMSFEEAMDELESLVRQLEEGQGELDSSIQAYERGALLKSHCEAKLKEAEARIQKIIPGDMNAGEGAIGVEPAEID